MQYLHTANGQIATHNTGDHQIVIYIAKVLHCNIFAIYLSLPLVIDVDSDDDDDECIDKEAEPSAICENTSTPSECQTVSY